MAIQTRDMLRMAERHRGLCRPGSVLWDFDADAVHPAVDCLFCPGMHFFLLGKKLVVFFSYRCRLPFFRGATGEDPCCTGGKFARVSVQKKTKYCSVLRDSVMPQHLSVQVPVVLRSCVGKKKHLARRLIATHQSTPCAPSRDCSGGLAVTFLDEAQRLLSRYVCVYIGYISQRAAGGALMGWWWHHSRRRGDCSHVLTASACIQTTSLKGAQEVLWRLL